MPFSLPRRERDCHPLALSLVALALLLSAGPVRGVEVQEILDAIMERRPPDLASMDLYPDGVVDVLDLLVWLRTADIDCDDPAASCPKAEFDLSTSSFDEGAGTVAVRVTLDIPFSGTLRYLVLNTYGDPDKGHVVGTAVEGADFTVPGAVGGQGTVAVSGWSAEIPIGIIEDAVELEGTETVVLLLIPDSPATYTLGPLIQHVLSITDNEIIWRGTLALQGTELDATLLLGRSGSGPFGRIQSRGHDTLPAGSWNLQDFTWTPTSFFARSEEIPIPCSESGAGVELRRVLEFQAEAGDPDHLLDPAVMAGRLRETILTPPGMEHLERTAYGAFVVAKSPPRSPTREPILFDAP